MTEGLRRRSAWPSRRWQSPEHLPRPSLPGGLLAGDGGRTGFNIHDEALQLLAGLGQLFTFGVEACQEIESLRMPPTFDVSFQMGPGFVRPLEGVERFGVQERYVAELVGRVDGEQPGEIVMGLLELLVVKLTAAGSPQGLRIFRILVERLKISVERLFPLTRVAEGVSEFNKLVRIADLIGGDVQPVNVSSPTQMLHNPRCGDICAREPTSEEIDDRTSHPME